jgi:DNA-directed RNA polymerase specialized sigma24 family protein
MDPLPEHERKDAGWLALLLRVQGHPYAEIGFQLECSKGKAHHLVSSARERQIELARELARPPGRVTEPTRERARQLLGRLELDFERLERLLHTHFVSDYDPLSLAERLEPRSATFAWNRAVLESALEPEQRQQRPLGVEASADTCSELERSFGELVAITVEADRTLREEIGPAFILAIFRRDLHELAQILGLDPPAEWDAEPPQIEGADQVPVDSEPAGMPLDAAGRRRRDERIVAARLGGVPVRELAEGYGISRRQVRRIVKRHREEHYVASNSVERALEGAVSSLLGDLAALDELDASALGAEEQRRIHERRMATMSRLAAILRDSGMTTEAYAAKRRADAAVAEARFDWVAGANAEVQRLFDQSEVEPDIREAVIEAILRSGGLEKAS